MNSVSLLSWAIFLPIMSGLIVLTLGHDRFTSLRRWFALLAACASFILTLPLYLNFDTTQAGMQFIERSSWFTVYNIQYYLGIDGISLWFVLLTALITVLVVIAAWTVEHKQHQYLASFLILSGLMIGVFCALDAVLFYVYFEATLIPMYLIIGVWGGERRVYAAFKFFLYTLMGSLLALLAIIYLFNVSHSFDILAWQKLPLSQMSQNFIFIAFFAAFAVKIPMWPVHTWLPDAHVEAPTTGSVVLAAIMLKLGAYGFLRFSMPIAPDASAYFATPMIVLSLIAVVYIGVVAIVQKDMKKLVAYSSIAHMGFVTLGFFTFNALALQGGIVQMISHGFISAAMFLCIGVLYDRLHTREIASYGGVVHVMPRYVAFLVLFSMANSGLPATSGFVGEFMVILGALKYQFWIGAIAATALILGASYSLWMIKRVAFGEITNPQVSEMKDLNSREFLILSILAGFVLFMGVYPNFFTNPMQATVAEFMMHIVKSKIPL